MPALSDLKPPPPPFLEEHIPDQTGKVFIVTGGSSGLGFEVTKVLYEKNGTVYIATRSIDKINETINLLREKLPGRKGRLEPLSVDLSDLQTIKRAVDEFVTKENRLDVLFNNAGVMEPPKGSKSAQGHDLEMGTNALGHHLFTSLLEPILVHTAQSTPHPGEVRIVWVSSCISMSTPKGGIVWDEATDAPAILPSAINNYMQSKVGNVYLAHDGAARLGASGVFSLSLHPGFMRTSLQRHVPAVVGLFMGIVMKPPRFGALTELFAAFSPAITADKNGTFLTAWGRLGVIPEHIAVGMRPEREGGSGLIGKFLAYCQRHTEGFR